MSEHNPNAWENGFDAWQNGYDDAMYDGIDTSSQMPCKCDACLKAYYEGQEAALKEICAGSQSAQHRVQRTCARCGANDWRDAIVPDTLEICNNCGASR